MAHTDLKGAKKSNGVPADGSGDSAPKGEPDKHKQQGPRRRVSQACDRCRARKDKCDGQRPVCTTCVSNGRTCSYDANVKKRGLPEGYVRGLEKLWGLAIRDVEDIEDNLLSALAFEEDRSETPLAAWNNEGTSETLVELWRKSCIWQELEKLLSSQEPNTRDFKRKRPVHELQPLKRSKNDSSPHGGTSNEAGFEDLSGSIKSAWKGQRLEQAQTNTYQDIPSMSSKEHYGAFGPPEYESILNPPQNRAIKPGGHLARGLQSTELPSETWSLIDVYFSYTHPWFPIIEKHDLLRTSYQYSQNRGTGNPASGENALLWACIAYAKFQSRAINNIPRALGVVGDMVWTAERMYKEARALIPNEEAALELGHVQALLLLTLTNMGTDFYSRAWHLIGTAVRAAIDLHFDELSEPISSTSKTRSRSKHVFLGCFVLDTVIAARLGRRPHLRSDDIQSLELLDEDSLEEWDPWVDCLAVRRNRSTGSRVPALVLSTFNGLVSVLRILNEAICRPSSITKDQYGSILLGKLHAWRQSVSLPPMSGSSTIEDTQASSLLPHQYHLYTVYFAIMASLQILSPGIAIDTTKKELCTVSAHHIVDLLQRHSDYFGMLIVPPTLEYCVKIAYNVVQAAKHRTESTPISLIDWRHRLDICLDSMEPAWPVFETLKTTSRSEGWALGHVPPMPASSVDVESSTPGTSQVPQTFIGYDNFFRLNSPQNGRLSNSEVEQSPGQVHSMLGSLRPRRESAGLSSGNGMPQNPLAIYRDAHREWGNLKSTTDKASPAIISLAQSFNIPTPIDPTHHRSLTGSSTDIDLADPLVNELMRLDATEWAGSSYQSLVNLGFTNTDPTNMSQDFYAFCQDPDPLSQINVFQQLVNGVDADVMDLFNGNLSDGLQNSTGSRHLDPGVNGVGQVDSSDGTEEAGQILAGLREG